MDYNRLKEVFDSVYKKELNYEELILALKNKGVSQGETTKLLCKELNISFFESDSLVLNASAWSEFREVNLKARDEIIDFLDTDLNTE
ncbi:MAG: hypothetical protein WBA74_08910 [Cyclobacteriaceae bacterium]